MKVIHFLYITIILMICSINVSACTKPNDFETILNIESNSKNEYVIHKKIDLKGKTIYLPDSHIIVFKDGCINNGTIVLGNNCKIRGNGVRLKANSSLIGTQIGHQSIFVAESVNNIIIENIVLEGSYNESMGHLNPWSDKSEDSQSLIFIRNCKNISMNNVRIRNFYNSKSTHFSSWDATYKSRWNHFPVNLYGCDSIQIKDCKQEKSCGEAWNIMNCKDITIENFYCKQKYATSMLTVVYCNNVVIRNSYFKANESFGNLVNIASVNCLVENNYISGGDLDFGNEHANIDLDLNNDGIYGDNKNYSVSNAKIQNNYLFNASITNNTVKQSVNTYPIADILITGNHLKFDISRHESLRAINLGRIGGIKTCEISNNYIEYVGKYCKFFSEKKSYRYIPIVVYFQNYPIDTLVIKRNTINDKATWHKIKSKTLAMTSTLGSAILIDVKRGNIIIEENVIKALYDINVAYRINVKISQSHNKIILR